MLISIPVCFNIYQFVNSKHCNETTDPTFHNRKLLAGMLMMDLSHVGRTGQENWYR